jgi:galactokinase
MTGGGFGGCTVNLVAPDSIDEFITTISREYEKETSMRPNLHICHPSIWATGTAGTAGTACA